MYGQDLLVTDNNDRSFFPEGGGIKYMYRQDLLVTDNNDLSFPRWNEVHVRTRPVRTMTYPEITFAVDWELKSSTGMDKTCW